MTINELHKLEDSICSKYNKAELALQELSRKVSNFVGVEIIADWTTDGIKYSKEYDETFDEIYSIEDLIEELEKDRQ